MPEASLSKIINKLLGVEMNTIFLERQIRKVQVNFNLAQTYWS